MSRHRNIRNIHVNTEYDHVYGENEYGRSVEDACLSPGTSQYMFKRDNEGSKPNLGNFFASHGVKIDEEDETEGVEDLDENQMKGALLMSCLDSVKGVLGPETNEIDLVDACLQHDCDPEKAVDTLLSIQAKPQRERRNRERTKLADGASEDVSVLSPTKGVASDVAKLKVTSSKQEKVTLGFHLADIDNDEASSSSKMVAVDTPDKEARLGTATPSTPSTYSTVDGGSGMKRSKSTKQFNVEEEYQKRVTGGKELLNLVVIGHVDAGKSTLMGHLLYQLGEVGNRQMHRYTQDSKKVGKASFSYAWVLDETEEERSRGITMDLAQTHFHTATKMVTLLDAPGHRDFIPNMITGAAAADAAILVVDATRGEFETGFDQGGQTREHALLVRSLGVNQVIVAVNKLDTCEWREDRFDEIKSKLTHFLTKQVGFRDGDVTCLPVSGLAGENLIKPPSSSQLSEWYEGPTLIDQIDKFSVPARPISRPFRQIISDVYRASGSGVCVSGRVESGGIHQGDKVIIMPQQIQTTVKSIITDSPDSTGGMCFCGEQALVTLTQVEPSQVSVGSILCDPNYPPPITSRIHARTVLFNTLMTPLTKGCPVVFHYQSLIEQAYVTRLVGQINKTTGEVVKKNPRCLGKNTTGVLEITLSRPICIELFKDYKELGRFMLRSSGKTIAAGIVTKILT